MKMNSSIFNVNEDEEDARLDHSFCSIVDEINQFKDRLRKTKQKKIVARKELKTLKLELEKYSKWSEDQYSTISSLAHHS